MYQIGILPAENHDLHLLGGVVLHVRPCDTVVYEAARAKMGRLITEFEAQQVEAAAVGVPLAGLPDLADPDQRAGFAQYLFVVALAQSGIIRWRGVSRAGHAVDLEAITPASRDAAIAEMMRDPAMADSFAVAYTRPYRALATEGNASAPAPHGSTAAGATTANVAASNPPAPAKAPAEAVAQ